MNSLQIIILQHANRLHAAAAYVPLRASEVDGICELSQEIIRIGLNSARLNWTVKSAILRRESICYITDPKWNRSDQFSLSGDFS